MSILADSVSGYLEHASWIRRMFEAGGQLKARFGEAQVCDFSLGNPDLPAPPAVARGLREFASHAEKPFAFGYMPNGGFAWAREKLAAHLATEQGVEIDARHVILGCGAAGVLNAFFRATLNPGEEVLGFAPYFVEYGFYTANHGANFRAVMSRKDTFAPDLTALEKAIGPKTRAVLVNSPNNPTGVIYSHDDMAALTELLAAQSRRYGRPIWLISDEPYRFLAYDDAQVPSVLPLYPHAVVVSSFSKSLSLPGERLGYAAISPLLTESAELMAALTLTTRILGFVNPPVIGQHIMAAALESQVDTGIYAARRAAMARVLREAGYDFLMPAGAFYFFPKAPGGDDVAFVNALLEERILAVPGTGFGCPGHFRLAFCVDTAVIERSAQGFARARAAAS